MPVCEATGDREPPGDVRAPTEVAWFRLRAEELGCRWQQLAFGPSFGAALADSGELFVWGSCPRRGEARRFLEPRPLLFEGAAPGLRFRDVQCSEKSIWALATTGEVVVWERAPAMLAELASAPPSQAPRVARGGKLVPGMDRPVRILSVGASHASFITDEGDLYCLGSNRCGECGIDPAKETAAAGCRLINFPRHCNPIARVSCGKTHTVAIGAEGQVLSWGDDSKIQLGLGDTRSNVGEERPWEGSRGLIRKMQTGESMATSSALRGGPTRPRPRWAAPALAKSTGSSTRTTSGGPRS
ncbi:unnamed protein product [Prorocentrum cordatum]|uniref:Uncharacterized protein n=1 Tax=Prorocentrum cordatum TaxID=2364126 RepID=A0ABN9VDN6_9DINO|nr:unnamed protein product [Polarella glacialis]